jgi:cytochrome c5
MRVLLIVALACLSSAGTAAQSAAPPAGVAIADVPATWQPAVAKAETAMSGLQSALLARLREELGRGGAEGALRVCHEEAKAIAARLAKEQGVSLGRTSHALRNADNAAPSWAVATVVARAGSRASEAEARAFDLGGAKIGMLRPIGFAEMCGACHGAREAMAPDVLEALEALYPRDKATGFKPGDLRGWMWAEVPLAAK